MKSDGRITLIIHKHLKGKSNDTFTVVVMENKKDEVKKAWEARGYKIY